MKCRQVYVDWSKVCMEVQTEAPLGKKQDFTWDFQKIKSVNLMSPLISIFLQCTLIKLAFTFKTKQKKITGELFKIIIVAILVWKLITRKNAGHIKWSFSDYHIVNINVNSSDFFSWIEISRNVWETWKCFFRCNWFFNAIEGISRDVRGNEIHFNPTLFWVLELDGNA